MLLRTLYWSEKVLAKGVHPRAGNLHEIFSAKDEEDGMMTHRSLFNRAQESMTTLIKPITRQSRRLLVMESF